MPQPEKRLNGNITVCWHSNGLTSTEMFIQENPVVKLSVVMRL